MKKSLIIFSILIMLFLISCSSDKNLEENKTIGKTTNPTVSNEKKAVQNEQVPVEQNTPEVVQPTEEAKPETQEVSPEAKSDSSKASFFITSTGIGSGDLGGLSGADQKCSSLANSANLPDGTWKAYLSTNSESAKSRIGSGPWYNTKGELIASNIQALHSSGIQSSLIYDEKGNAILDPSGSSLIKTDHDVLTGSSSDGTVAPFPNNPDAPNPNCNGWTNGNGDWSNGPFAFVGHADWSANGQEGVPSWNAAHEAPCSKEGLASTGGSGKLYCFRTN